MSVINAGAIDHVAIAVHDLDASCELYQELLGAELTAREVVAGQAVEVAFLQPPGTARIELISPVDESSPVAGFLAGRGPGLHHICVLVEDVDVALADLVSEDVELIDTVSRPGAEGSRIAFLHPKALGGVLLELKQKADGS